MPPENETVNETQDSDNGETPETWEAWLAQLDEAERERVTALDTQRTAGLRSALEKERETKSDLEKQLREMRGKAAKGSELETQLNEALGHLETERRRSDFITEAVKPEIGVADLEAAWLIVNAKADDFVTRKGFDFALLRQRHPSLFRRVSLKTNGGEGSQPGEVPKRNMNDLIRDARRGGSERG